MQKSVELCYNDTDMENRSTGRRTCLVSLCRPQIPYGQSRDRILRGDRPETNRLSHGSLQPINVTAVVSTSGGTGYRDGLRRVC
jgi:hypothetical protein